MKAVSASLADVRAESDETSSLRFEWVRCCICETEDAHPVGIGKDFEYECSRDTFVAMRCDGCGLMYLNPRPAESELDRIYPPSYHAFDFTPEKFGLAHTVRRRLEARRLLSYCKGLPANARILDIGCGDGFHLGLLREFGRPSWSVEGIDTSDRAVSAARAAGLDVHLGRVESAELPERSYDLILLIATIEHVGDPVAVLRAARKLLKIGGRAVIVTDSTETLDFRLFGRAHWGGYHFPRHWNLFHRHALERLAAKAELAVLDIGTTMSPVNWVYSIRNRLVDNGYPKWLVECFSLKAPVSLIPFTLLDAAFQLFGKGALLRMIVQRAS